MVCKRIDYKALIVIFRQCGNYRGHRIYDSGALRIQSDTVIERKPTAAGSREIISPGPNTVDGVEMPRFCAFASPGSLRSECGA
jgi:hypothetical protein